jgi:hypothetical protein
MTQPAKSQEPSMEEILASIRRIIADDDATKTAPRAPEAPKAELPPQPPYPPSPPPPQFEPDPIPAVVETAAEPSDILDLTETMAASMPQPNSQFRTIDGTSDVGFDDAGDRPAAPPVERGHLVSNETSAAVDSAFSALAQTVLVQNARTLEDLVREMLRPMLKSWLDDNLPGMVERLVRAEIERVSRGRTG